MPLFFRGPRNAQNVHWSQDGSGGDKTIRSKLGTNKSQGGRAERIGDSIGMPPVSQIFIPRYPYIDDFFQINTPKQEVAQPSYPGSPGAFAATQTCRWPQQPVDAGSLVPPSIVVIKNPSTSAHDGSSQRRRKYRTVKKIVRAESSSIVPPLSRISFDTKTTTASSPTTAPIRREPFHHCSDKSTNQWSPSSSVDRHEGANNTSSMLSKPADLMAQIRKADLRLKPIQVEQHSYCAATGAGQKSSPTPGCTSHLLAAIKAGVALKKIEDRPPKGKNFIASNPVSHNSALLARLQQRKEYLQRQSQGINLNETCRNYAEDKDDDW